jgi:nucleoside kinase
MVMKKYDVITSGYVSMDHMLKISTPAAVGFTSLIKNKTNSQIYYGGCSVNIAYALCRLGLTAMPVLRVGGDYEKTGFQAFLEEGGVPTEGITVVEDETTSVCYLVQDNKGQHITIFYPGAMDAKYARPLDDELFENAGLGVVTVAARPDNQEFFQKCKAHNVPIVFGMKSDFDAFPIPFLKELLLYSKIIFTNETERETIEKLFELEDITDLLRLGSAEIIVTTYGQEGSKYYRRQPDGSVDTACIPICDCTCVVDTTGSGDGYMAGFLYAYLKGMPMADCCRMGSTLSSFIIEKEGCCTNAPSAEALMERFTNFKTCV